jgi:integrase
VSLAKDGTTIKKSWIFKYRVRGTKREQRMGLGASRDVGVADTRNMAAEQRLLLAQGKDPMQEPDARRGAVAPATGHPMVELRSVGTVSALALEFVILTACRSGELLKAAWSEIDYSKRIWNIPRSHLKADGEEEDKSHTIPLSDAAMVVLNRLATVLDATQPDQKIVPIAEGSMLDTLKEIRPGVTVHGMRACFKSWAGACTPHPREVVEMALCHKVGNMAERAYARDSLLAKRRLVMNNWAAHIAHRPADVLEFLVGELGDLKASA